MSDDQLLCPSPPAPQPESTGSSALVHRLLRPSPPAPLPESTGYSARVHRLLPPLESTGSSSRVHRLLHSSTLASPLESTATRTASSGGPCSDAQILNGTDSCSPAAPPRCRPRQRWEQSAVGRPQMSRPLVLGPSRVLAAAAAATGLRTDAADRAFTSIGTLLD